MRTLIIAAGASVLALLPGCQKRQAGASHAKIDACTLLTAQDVQEVQNAPLKDTKATEQTNGRTLISQCYFATDPPHQSISLSTTQSDPSGGDADAAKDYWRQIAQHSPQGGEREEEREKRESVKQHEHEHGEEEDTAPL